MQGEGSVVFGVQKKFEPLLLVYLVHSNHEKQNKIEKVSAPQSRGVKKKNKKNKPPNVTKVNSKIPKKFFICCFVVIRVQR